MIPLLHKRVRAAGLNQLHGAVVPLPVVSSRGSCAITFDTTQLGSGSQLSEPLFTPTGTTKPVNTT